MSINHLVFPPAMLQLLEAYRTQIEKLKKTPIIVAIDGHSSCGKSTLSRSLAQTIGYRYIDTGAMYRAVTLYLLDYNIDITNSSLVEKALEDIDIEFVNINGNNTTLLNGNNVESAIRTLRVSEHVSEVATLSVVRRHLVAQQQKMGIEKAIVMDGRDIGTVVFPEAQVKIFMTADLDTRAQRRYEELQQKGQPTELGAVKKNLSHRDHIDSTREDSPLRQADDAIVLDSSQMTPEQQLAQAVAIVAEKC